MKLKNLVKKYGKAKINTLTKYPSILTLHTLGKRGVLNNELTTDITGETMYASEKIDGTNVRIICYGDEFLIGSRKNILHYSEDFYWDEALDIVNQFYKLKIPALQTDKFTIVFGELFGGKVTAGSKNYGKDSYGFRVFDIAEIADLSILDKSISEISSWRESTLDSSISEMLRYGQGFLNREAFLNYSEIYNLVPNVEFSLKNYKHETVYNALKESIPETLVALSDSAHKKPEGLILRNSDRTKIVKVRFEDYERTLKNKQ